MLLPAASWLEPAARILEVAAGSEQVRVWDSEDPEGFAAVAFDHGSGGCRWVIVVMVVVTWYSVFVV